MADEWRKIADAFVNGTAPNSSKVSTTSKTNTTSTASNSAKTSSTSKQSLMDSFAGSRKITIDVAPVTKKKKEEEKWYEKSLLEIIADNKKKKKKDEDDIAPTKAWYESGLFEDGYDFGDVTKTILGINDDSASLKDLTVNSAKRGYYNSLYGEESFKAMNNERNQKEVYEKILAGEDYQFAPGNDFARAVSGAFEQIGQQARQFTNPRTIAAAGTAATAASIAGQVGPQVLLPEEILTVPAATIAGFTAGSATSNLEIEAGHAYNEMVEAGISEETAKKVAWGVGSVNAGLELLQVDELVDAFKVVKGSGATKGVARKILKELADRGVDVAKETAQEVAQEGVTIAGVQTANKIDNGEYIYTADEVKDRLLDTAKSSALSFGMMNVPAAAKNTASIVSEQHNANKLTTNEQAVVDKVVEQRIADKEKDGNKITDGEKKTIEKQVRNELEKGYISIDTIEEVLGGDSFTNYNKLLEESKEYEELYNTESGKLSAKQNDRLAELKEKNKANPYETALQTARNTLSESVMGLAEGSRLAESYNERSRRGQAFEADLSKYNEKQRAVVQKAIDSGILNNTNRTHEFVDMIAKISADKGVLFDFTNNEKLKDSGFAIEGKQVNGFVTKDGVTLNIDSAKALNTTVGHEITHVLEGTELYTELQNVLFEYAKSKGEYDGRHSALAELYKDIKDADIDAELTADLVGDYLFTDADFINRLSTEHRNVFQKIYDEIKYLCKVVTAGSKEARELEKVKKAFEQAYKADGKGLGDTKYSISTDSTGKQLTPEQREYFKDSKVTDENGNLKVMYHGSQDAGFHVFDSSFSDDDTSFFFVDRNDVAATYSGTGETYSAVSFRTVKDANKFFADNGLSEYEVVEDSGEYVLLDNGDVVAASENLNDLYDEFRDWAGVGYGDANYKVYLNLTNPLVVDAQGAYWNELPSFDGKHKIELLEYDDYSGRVEVAYYRDSEPYKTKVFHESDLADVFGFRLADRLLSGEAIPAEPKKTRDYAAYAKEQGYDGVIFKNIVDNGGYSNGSEGASTVAIAFNSNQIKSVANAKPTADADIRYSLSEDSEQSIAQKINESLTMQEAKQMIQRAFVLGNVKEWYEGEYKNGDDWLKGEGAEDVAMIIENEYTLQAAYIDKIPGLLNEEFYLTDVLDAYSAGTLTGKVKKTTERINLADGVAVADKRFYAPKEIENAKALYEIANQRLTNSNKEEINSARAAILLYAHNKGAAETLGITNSELNKKLRSWGGYSAKARDISMRINNGAHISNRWTGIESVSWLNKSTVSNDEIVRMVKAVEGNGDDYQNKYIARTMLALDTHIDWSWLTIKFDSYAGVNASQNSTSGKCNGYYSNADRFIHVKYDAPNTVAHEMGHALDYQWGRDLGFSSALKEVSRNTERLNGEAKTWHDNFKAFTDELVSSSDIRSAYSMDVKETFARFVSKFVEWTEQIGTGRSAGYESNFYNDKFTGAQFVQFARLLQEKSAIDAKGLTENKFSLSAEDEAPMRHGSYNVTGKDIALAPVKETVADNASVEAPTREFESNTFSETEELYNLENRKAELDKELEAAYEAEDMETFFKLDAEYASVIDRMAEIKDAERDRLESLNDAPPEVEAPYYEDSKPVTPKNPFADKNIDEDMRHYKSFVDENPDVKPLFQYEAEVLLQEWNDAIRGERIYNSQTAYELGNEYAWKGSPRLASEDISYLLDSCHYTYNQIKSGLQEIIEDAPKKHAVAKRIEFLINDRLLNGYTYFGTNYEVPPNQDYIDLLNEWQVNEDSTAAFDMLMENADAYAPPVVEDVAPVKPTEKTTVADEVAPTLEEVKVKGKGNIRGQKVLGDVKPEAPKGGKTANVLTEMQQSGKKGFSIWSWAKEHLLDNGMVFEDVAKRNNNRELEAKWNKTRNAAAMAQRLIGKGANGVKSLKDIEKVVSAEHEQQFLNYLYHVHNIDRMSLDKRFGVENKAVFGDEVTADISRAEVKQYESAYPQFKEWAKDVYAYNKHLRTLLVDNGVISQGTAALWEKMYPHYVPTVRVDDEGVAVNVPLDTYKTGVNAPVKRATGGNSDIRPLFDVMAQRTMQTYRAITRNSFGVELKNTLGSTVANDAQRLDDVIDGIDYQEELLKEGKRGANPTFTVFENGERVEFEITEEMYEALKPRSKAMQYKNKLLNGASDLFRNLTTQYNPTFFLTNPIKDIQDVLINSQHPGRTYANLPRAIVEQNPFRPGKYYQEYLANGGENNTYFDTASETFTEKGIVEKGLDATVGWLNNHIEMTPRLAEYIASRQAGRSIDVAMLDAARVTTNFAAGGDVTKLLNRNGATFLNASVQGAIQQVRNVREAHHKGLMGYVGLATRFAVAGLPALVLNDLRWGDDEEYEELPDYIKQGYYIIDKTDDGKFIRIPKGRTLAVIQDAFQQVSNALTGDDEVDLGSFLKLVADNIAPNNPLTNNIAAPLVQAYNNKAWYDGDIVPTRLQDLPATEQYDHKTDALSIKASKALSNVGVDISPYKINYVLNQYSGGLGDTLLPFITPKAESADDTVGGKLLAPLRDKFTTDPVMNNRVVDEFYDLSDALEVQANSAYATDEDKLKSMFMTSHSYDLSDLYKKQREIQSSDLPDSQKYANSRAIQKQINEAMEKALGEYGNVDISGVYAEVGDRRFNKSSNGKWYELSEDYDPYGYYEREQEVTQGFGISYGEYWNNRETYNDAYWFATSYDKNLLETAKSVFGASAFASYANDLSEFKADYDKNGKSISGSKKKKVSNYVYSLDIPEAEKHILFKSQYNSFDDANYEIIDYLNGRDDINYSEMESILKELGFEVDSKGYITW